MGAITGTISGNTEFAGSKKLVTVTATIAAASDVITLVAADVGFKSIDSILSTNITSGTATTLSHARSSFSGLVITVVSYDEAMTVSTSGGGVEIVLLVNV